MGDRVATLRELRQRREARRPLWAQAAGLVLMCVAVAFLAGPFWAVLLVGAMLFASGVLREAGWL